jgi:SAM-dependent methyltransferase
LGVGATMRQRLQQLIDKTLPKSARRRAWRYLRRSTRWPPVGFVRFGSLRRVTPLSRDWGFDRGQPVDRHFIEQFLAKHAGDIYGHVLEIGTDMYTRRFGGAGVTRSEVLDVAETHPHVTIVADLTEPDPEQLQAETFDCFILTQTLHFIYDVRAALCTARRVLKPGGVLLLTAPGLAPINRYEMDRWGDYWRFTSRSLERLLKETFPSSDVKVEAHGNVLACVAFLHGISADELKPSELEHADPDFQLSITARVRKSELVS